MTESIKQSARDVSEATSREVLYAQTGDGGIFLKINPNVVVEVPTIRPLRRSLRLVRNPSSNGK